MKKILTLSLFFLSLKAFSEYRVYQYLVKPTSTTVAINRTQAQTILSTLDPVSYKRYSGGENAVTATLMKTWKCSGYTGRKRDYCPHPLNQLEGIP